MQYGNAEFGEAITARARQIRRRMTISGPGFKHVLTDREIVDVDVIESVNSGSKVTVGDTCSSYLSAKLRYNLPDDINGARVEYEAGTNDIFVPMGTFWIVDASNVSPGTVQIEAYDALEGLNEREYTSTLTYPASATSVAQELAQQAGMALSPDNVYPDIQIELKPEGYGLRESIGYLAGCMGTYAKMTRDNCLRFAWYSPANSVIDKSRQHFSGLRRLGDYEIDVSFKVYAGAYPAKEIGVEDIASIGSPWDIAHKWMQDPTEIMPAGYTKWAVVYAPQVFGYHTSAEENRQAAKRFYVMFFSDDATYSALTHSYLTPPAGTYKVNASKMRGGIYYCNFYQSCWGELMNTSSFAFVSNVDLYDSYWVNAVVYASNFLPSEAGMPVFGENFEKPAHGEMLLPEEMFQWKMNDGNVCFWDTFNPALDSSYANDTLQYKFETLEQIPKKWVMLSSGLNETSAGLLETGRNLALGDEIVFADEIWLKGGWSTSLTTPDPVGTFYVAASYPRYIFQWNGEDLGWQLSYVEFEPAFDYTDDNGWIDRDLVMQRYGTAKAGRVKIDTASEPAAVNTSVMFSSHYLYSTYGHAVQGFGLLPTPYMIFPQTLEENIHSCTGGKSIIVQEEADLSGVDGDGTLVTYVNGYTNPWITEGMVEAIQACMPTLKYYPLQLKWRGDPRVEAGDIVTVIDSEGKEFATPILTHTMKFTGGMVDDLAATADNFSGRAFY